MSLFLCYLAFAPQCVFLSGTSPYNQANSFFLLSSNIDLFKDSLPSCDCRKFRLLPVVGKMAYSKAWLLVTDSNYALGLGDKFKINHLKDILIHLFTVMLVWIHLLPMTHPEYFGYHTSFLGRPAFTAGTVSVKPTLQSSAELLAKLSGNSSSLVQFVNFTFLVQIFFCPPSQRSCGRGILDYPSSVRLSVSPSVRPSVRLE